MSYFGPTTGKPLKQNFITNSRLFRNLRYLLWCNRSRRYFICAITSRVGVDGNSPSPSHTRTHKRTRFGVSRSRGPMLCCFAEPYSCAPATQHQMLQCGFGLVLLCLLAYLRLHMHSDSITSGVMVFAEVKIYLDCKTIDLRLRVRRLLREKRVRGRKRGRETGTERGWEEASAERGLERGTCTRRSGGDSASVTTLYVALGMHREKSDS